MRNCIWFRTLNVPNLKYERLDHNSAKVVPLQVFGKFSLLLPYPCRETPDGNLVISTKFVNMAGILVG